VHTLRKSRDLVLVGGGHAHVQVLKMLAMRAPPDVQVTLVSHGSSAYYSGMFPGVIAGLYEPAEATIELRPLARWCGARFMDAEVVDIDPDAREVRCAGRPPLRFDLCSVNVGSTTRALDLPGIQEHAVPTRPIAGLLRRIQAFEEGFPAERPVRVVVVGGGAAGVELTFTLEARFRRLWGQAQVSLVDASDAPLAERGTWSSSLVREALSEKRIQLVTGARAASAAAETLVLEDGRELPFDLLVWATGGAAHPFLGRTALECDDRGFMRVHDNLQSVSSPRVFGAGDCVQVGDHQLPKAGVYSVREGPVLAENLLRALTGREPRPYRPQSGFLALLATGDGEAILSWRGLAGRGAWAWRLKDWIDRRFMRLFDARELGTSPMAMAGSDAPEEAQPMRCMGCGSKVGAAALQEALGDLEQPEAPHVRLGLESGDDAAVVEVPAGMLQVQTVDYFPNFLDDPYVVGRVAAIHAASDLFAMGAKPETALVTLNVAESHPRRAGAELRLVLAGIVEELKRMGAALVGGHTTESAEPGVGLAMTGLVAEEKVLAKGGLEAGDALVLTKPLGTGVILAADMRLQARGAWVDACLASMLTSNQEAARCLEEHGVRGATDVTGFGLAGHLGEMLRASGCAARLDMASLPRLFGATLGFAGGVFSTLDPDNREAVRDLGLGIGGGADEAILYDPQTSGGLLAAVPADHAEDLVSSLHRAGYHHAAVIGHVLAGPPRIELV
jgi:selenide,water dikinase